MKKRIIFCGICDSRYVRKKNHKKYVWHCHVFHNQGKEQCSAKQIPNDVIKELTKDFDKEISKIIVLPNNQLQFIFKDDSQIKKGWKQPSRKDSWILEMKEKARRQTLKRNSGDV